MSESKTSQRRLEAIENQRKALELRKAGVTFVVIAEQLGYRGPSGAYRAVMSALKRTLQEPADEVRTLELERLDALLLALWAQAKQGQQGAVDRVLKVMERRAKLLGLDAPTKTDVRIQDLDDAIERELARVAGTGESGDAGAAEGMADAEAACAVADPVP